MMVERVIDWLGGVSAGSLPAEVRSERVMRLDSILKATIKLTRMLNPDQNVRVARSPEDGIS